MPLPGERQFYPLLHFLSEHVPALPQPPITLPQEQVKAHWCQVGVLFTARDTTVCLLVSSRNSQRVKLQPSTFREI